MVNYQQPVRGGLVNLGGTKSRFQGTLGALFFLSLLLPTLAPFFFVVFFFFHVETHGNMKGGGTHRFLFPRIGLLGGGME